MSQTIRAPRALAVSAGLLLALTAACGSDDSSSAAGDPSSATSSTASSSSASPSSSAAPSSGAAPSSAPGGSSAGTPAPGAPGSPLVPGAPAGGGNGTGSGGTGSGGSGGDVNPDQPGNQPPTALGDIPELTQVDPDKGQAYLDALHAGGLPAGPVDQINLQYAPVICQALDQGRSEGEILGQLQTVGQVYASTTSLNADQVAQLYLDAAKQVYC